MFNIPIFLSSDNNYAPFIATTIASICDHTNSFCEFYVLDGGILKENREKIEKLKDKFDNFSIEYLSIEIDKHFKNLKNTKYISKSMYSRFLIPELKPEIDKAIYSDVDVIVLDDISKMYNEDLEGYALGAVWQELYDKTQNMENLKKRLDLSPTHKVFFSGNLLIDCKKWREKNIISDLIKGYEFLDNLTETPDQDILNKYFENNYKVLSEKYCFVNQAYDYYKKPNNVVIRHYNGQIKPWQLDENTHTSLFYNLSDFWYYAKITEFYNDLKLKTLDTNAQKQYLRQLQYWKIMANKNVTK